MTRHRSSSFQGSPVYDVDPDALTYQRVIYNAVGDTTLTWDKLTGANSPPASTTITHVGLDTNYRGCPLGIPLGMGLVLVGAGENGPTPVKLDTSSTGWKFIAAVPFLLPRGEDSIDVSYLSEFLAGGVVVVVRDSSLSVVNYVEDAEVVDGHPTTFRRVRVNGLTGGTSYYLTIERDVSIADNDWAFRPPQIFFHRKASATTPLCIPGSLSTNTYTVPRTATAGPGYAVDYTSIASEILADDFALTSYVVSRTNQNQNAVEEFLTGAPAGGNATLQLVDSASADPGAAAFHDHSGSTYSGEALVEVPLWLECFGGIDPDGTTGNFTSGWAPPGIKTNLATIFRKVLLYMPDAPAGALTSKLAVRLLAANPDSDVATDVDVSIRCLNSGGTSAGTATGTFSNIANDFWSVTVGTVPFHPDVVNILEISFTANYLKAYDGTSFVLLGGSAALVP